MVDVYTTTIDDVEIQVVFDDAKKITDISIKHGARAMVYTVRPPYNNIRDGLKFIQSISGIDDLLTIKNMAIDFIDQNFILKTPNYIHHNPEEATFHTDPYDPDYIEILKERTEEETQKKSIKRKE